MRLFQIKCLIHGNTRTNKALGKTGKKPQLSAIPLDGRGKQNLEQNQHGLSGHSNALTQPRAGGEGAALTLWGLDYRLVHEVSQSALIKRLEEEEGLLYSRSV